MLDTGSWRHAWRAGGALALLCLVAPGARLLAQAGGSIAGKVTDEQGAPIVGARVAIVQLGRTTATLANGTYTIEAVPAAAHTGRASFICYRGPDLPCPLTDGHRA